MWQIVREKGTLGFPLINLSFQFLKHIIIANLYNTKVRILRDFFQGTAIDIFILFFAPICMLVICMFAKYIFTENHIITKKSHKMALNKDRIYP